MPEVRGTERFRYLKPHADQPGHAILDRYSIADLRGRPILWSDMSRAFWLFANLREMHRFLAGVAPAEMHYFELIYGEFPQKPKFDVDGGGLRRFNQILRAVRKAAGRSRVIVTDSSGPAKFSRHIIIDRYVSGAAAALELAEEVVSEVGEDNIDLTVYKIWQQFRTTGSAKSSVPGAPRKRILTRGVTFDDTLIGKYKK